MYSNSVTFLSLIKICLIFALHAVLVNLIGYHHLPQLLFTLNLLNLCFVTCGDLHPVESSYGYTYFLTIVDAFSRFTWIYPLKLKSHTFTTFQNFKTMIELQLNHKIKAVQSDGGGEFRPFTKFLNDQGIIHRFTCPHTHHQNGSEERKRRHIVETGLTLLAHAKLPLSFLGSCFHHCNLSHKQNAYTCST